MRLPSSLFGRNVLLIMALIVISQGASFVMFYLVVQKPRIAQLATYTAAYVKALDVALTHLPADERERYIASVNTDTRLHIDRTAPPVEDEIDPALRPMQLFIETLREKLDKQIGRHAEVKLVRGTPNHIWMRVDTELGSVESSSPHYWYRISTDRLVVEFPAALLGMSLLFAVLALLGAYLIQARINLPLQRLADAARQLQRGEHPQPLTGDAPTEIATVSESFNAMVKSLAEAENERAIMLAGISHDLRTPLTKLQLGLAMTEISDTGLRASMERQIVEMNDIIGQFIDFARLDSEEATDVLDLNELVRELARSYDSLGHHFELDLMELPSLSLRPVSVRRMVGNLMENAMRYGGKGLEVRTRCENDKVALTVLDRGPGVPADMIGKLARPFVRTDEARSNNSGSGLGLAIVERIARSHGGSLHLELCEGGGFLAKVLLRGGAR